MSKKIISSVIQIVIVMVAVPLLILLLSAVFPDVVRKSFWNSLLGLLEDVPLTGSVLGLVESFYTMTQTAEGYLYFFADFVHEIGSSVVEALVVGMMVHTFRELSVMVIPGVPAVACMLGAFSGVFVVKLTQAFTPAWHYGFLIFFVVANVALIYLTEIADAEPTTKAKKVIDTVMLGFQAIIAGFSLFFTACVLWLFVNKPADFGIIVKMWVIPAIIMSAMLVVDYIAATAESYRFI